jgi:hypothetical protein
MSLAVRDVKDARERTGRAAATRTALEAKGVRVVDEPNALTGGASKVRRLGSGFGAVHIKHSLHRKEPCHAAVIGFDGSAVYVCTDPALHAGEAGSGVQVEPDAKAKRAATRAANQARRTAGAARMAKARELVTSGAAIDVDYICGAVVAGAPWDAVLAAIDLLGLEVSADTAWDRERRAILAYAGTNTDHLRRAALAIQLAAAEREAKVHPDRGIAGRLVLPYLDFLAAAGYGEGPGDTALRERYAPQEQEVA